MRLPPADLLRISNIATDYRNPADYILYRPHGSGDLLFINFITPVHVDLPNGERVLTPPHSCALFTPGARQWYAGIDRPYRHHWLHCDWNADLARLIADLGLPTNIPFRPSSTEFVRPLMVDAAVEFHARLGPWQELAALSLIRLLVLLARASRAEDDETRTRARVRARLQAVRAEVLADPGRAWRVAELAVRAGLSPSHFTASHRTCFGETAKQFLLATRIEHARRLLSNQALTISEVAERSGFSSLFEFSRCFKRETGCPPSRFQELARRD